MHDPLADATLAKRELGVSLVATPEVGAYDAIVLAVPHAGFVSDTGRADLRRWARSNAVVYDTKSALEGVEVDGRL